MMKKNYWILLLLCAGHICLAGQLELDAALKRLESASAPPSRRETEPEVVGHERGVSNIKRATPTPEPAPVKAPPIAPVAPPAVAPPTPANPPAVVASMQKGPDKTSPKPAQAPEVKADQKSQIPKVAVPQTPQSAQPAEGGKILQMDEQEQLNARDIGFEPTTLAMTHTFTAAAFQTEGAPIWTRKLVVSVPVLYRTKTMRLDAQGTARAHEILIRLEALKQKSAEITAEANALRNAWAELRKEAVPVEALLPLSPTLPESEQTAIPKTDMPQLPTGKPASFVIE